MWKILVTCLRLSWTKHHVVWPNGNFNQVLDSSQQVHAHTHKPTNTHTYTHVCAFYCVYETLKAVIVLYIHSQSTIFFVYFNNYCSGFFYCRFYIYFLWLRPRWMFWISSMYKTVNIFFFFKQSKKCIYFLECHLGLCFSPVCNAACFLSHNSTHKLWGKQSWQKTTFPERWVQTRRVSLPLTPHTDGGRRFMTTWTCFKRLHISSVEAVPCTWRTFL